MFVDKDYDVFDVDFIWIIRVVVRGGVFVDGLDGIGVGEKFVVFVWVFGYINYIELDMMGDSMEVRGDNVLDVGEMGI